MSEQDTARSGQHTTLVEFQQRSGVRQVALSAPDTVSRSAEAVAQAMGTIHDMAERVRSTVADMSIRPDGVQVSFGIKFDAEAGAVIAKAKVESSITVTLTWGSETAR